MRPEQFYYAAEWREGRLVPVVTRGYTAKGFALRAARAYKRTFPGCQVAVAVRANAPNAPLIDTKTEVALPRADPALRRALAAILPTEATADECPECGGSGVCPDCHGEGGDSNAEDADRIDCDYCNGTGICPVCGGPERSGDGQG